MGIPLVSSSSRQGDAVRVEKRVEKEEGGRGLKEILRDFMVCRLQDLG